MKKKILIIGNGAKEYALARKLSLKHDIYITPKNDTLSEFANTLDIREDNIQELLEFALENSIDMTIPISMKSIKAGVVDKFSQNNLFVFGPSTKSAELVTDKAQAKKVLYKLRIPTPKFGIFEKQNMAVDYIKNYKSPFVLKNEDNNSATVFTKFESAKNILEEAFWEKKKVLIEDYVYGTPFSYYAITDGYKALPFGSSINYKFALDGDGGQLTSGMGSGSPNYKLSIEQEYFLMDNVIYPTLDYLEINGSPYLGILGVNGIITDDGGITILGYQSFLSDSDSCSVLEIVEDDIYSLFESCVVGSFSDEVEQVMLKPMYSTTLVLTNRNKNNKENSINGIDNLDDSIITFYPSVRKNKYLEFEADYGSVLSITNTSATLNSAINKTYEDAKYISYDGIYYRKDLFQQRESHL